MLSIEKIFISPERDAAQIECKRIAVEAGKGVLGDRYIGLNAYPGQNLTLVEAEEIELFCAQQGLAAELSLTRRNLVTRGVRLNALVGCEFTIGEVRLRGVEFCEPCASLGKRLNNASLRPAAVVESWRDRDGLRVDVLTSGEIACSDCSQTEFWKSG
jgi:MOSC domain-containing protein YiiM